MSLALYLQGPPHFLPKVKEDEMPPDAAPIAAFGAGCWRSSTTRLGCTESGSGIGANYAALVERYHVPLAKMVFDNDIYLKMQSGGYLGRTFDLPGIFLGDPSEANARNYGKRLLRGAVSVAGPEFARAPLKMEEIRHAYLHYLLDPLAEKHFQRDQADRATLQSVKRAPLEESFKSDISLSNT